MNGFGGIVCFEEYGIDSGELINMSRAAAVGSLGRSESFLCEHSALFCNSHDADGEALPYICTRRSAEFALVLDGDIDARAVMEKYFIGGIEALNEIGSTFALALYDSEHERLILQRGKRGSAPLFFSHTDGTVRFASKPFSLLASNEKFDIDTNALAKHITAPAGVYGFCDIYKGIFELCECECVVFNTLGASRFAISPTARNAKNQSYSVIKKEKRIIEPTSVFSYDSIGECLSDALVAFGYPQFDFLMPTFCKSLKSALKQGREKLYFYDPLRRESLSYSEERASRLGALYGIHTHGVLCRADLHYLPSELCELCKMQYALWQRVSVIPQKSRKAVDDILGKQEHTRLLAALSNDVKRAENGIPIASHIIIRNIRTLGLLWQAADIIM